MATVNATPTLPYEIEDRIVHDASRFPDTSERIQALCSTALVCQRFRSWSQKRLFREISMQDRRPGGSIRSIEKRLTQFLNIIREHPNSQTPGIASHIRVFHLHLVGEESIQFLAQSEEISEILRVLFRDVEEICELSLSFYPDPNMWKTDADLKLDWMSTRQSFRDAVCDICQFPCLNILGLGGISNLPSNILHHSHIRRLTLLRISLLDSETVPAHENNDEQESVCHLEQLNTDLSCDIPRLLNASTQANTSLSTVLKHLISVNFVPLHSQNVQLVRQAEATIISQSSALKEVKLRLNGFTAEDIDDTTPVNFEALQHLTNLRLYCPCGPWLIPEDAEAPHWFPDLCQFLLYAKPPPNLQILHLCLDIYSRGLAVGSRIIADFNFSPLDEMLSSRKYEYVESINLDVSIKVPKIAFRGLPLKLLVTGFELEVDSELRTFFLPSFFSKRSENNTRLTIDIDFC